MRRLARSCSAESPLSVWDLVAACFPRKRYGRQSTDLRRTKQTFNLEVRQRRKEAKSHSGIRVELRFGRARLPPGRYGLGAWRGPARQESRLPTATSIEIFHSSRASAIRRWSRLSGFTLVVCATPPCRRLLSERHNELISRNPSRSRYAV